MDENQINQVLKNVKRYQGSFALDELDEINVFEQPTFAIINLDTRSREGVHWIAVAIYLKKVFICDSLGGLVPSEAFPEQLIHFLRKLCYTRKIYVTKQLQPTKTL